MSNLPHAEPTCTASPEPAIALAIKAHTRDLGGGFTVRRLLPALARRSVGPFVFFDHMGPVRMAPGLGLDVRPHPHIGLATVTYLTRGEIFHRDSLGTEQVIRPGAVNWMTAGRGIVHSERSPEEARATGPELHGLQLWVGLPRVHEEIEPSFQHHPAETIPELERNGVRLRIIAGSAYGESSPVQVLSALFYVEAWFQGASELLVPDEYAEAAAYVLEGEIDCDGEFHREGTMLVFRAGARPCLRASAPARVMLIGGAPLDGERYLDWNFVASSRARLAVAKDDWLQRRFPLVPGDEVEFIPLPEPRV